MKKNDYILLALALVAFLLFQGILIYRVSVTDYDEAVFLDVARNIHRVGLPLRSIGPNGLLYFIHTPLYLYLVSGSVTVLGDNPTLVRLVNTFLGAGSIVLVYLAVRQRRTAVASFVAASLLALNTFVAIYAYFLTMEVPMMFCILLAVYWLARDEVRPSWSNWLWVGAAVATAVLLKELALFFVTAVALYALITGRNWQERIQNALLGTLPTIIGLGFWGYWGFSLNATQFQNGIMNWVNFASGSTHSADGRTATLLGAWLQQLGGDLLGWGTTFLFFISLAAFGLWFRRKLPRIVLLLFLYLGLAFGASLLISLKELRHVIALVPAVSMIIAYLIDWQTVWEWTKQNRIRWAMAAIIVLLLAWSVSPLKIAPRDQWRNVFGWWEPLFLNRILTSQLYFYPVRDAGLYLAEHTPPDTVIAVIHEGPVMGYYADRNHYFLYTMPHDRTMEILANTQYLVVDHVVFSFQTDEEIAAVMAYIDENFELEQIFEDQFRQIKIYHRRITS
ncbi:MAG: glycosyltransferase family 39 protein [Ardenticatenaceae bacterium]|nr:glycosyltransferase family 39 protein [Ardenticatenaceae bacterium]